ncbi:alpha-1,3-mannosyltransferase [Rhodoblastus acidophilus]|uniref:glycosyltransferase family 4 protein n=1 Tax=Rhodoblastus acidophilus TaxID=1074 RepID=UPI002225AFC1|nr:glycosyltransferase family 4 protein [Rhodoblastus acidophilus]MCW2285944.1 alpha-1,3-mannosyltransferase [Rhodoblastus acidophilus]MCW2334838.1 alpha-1,3-mannosyltransferase [Rhodoblastus acidophilus]
MKIIHVVRQYWPLVGGLEEFVARLAREQRLAGASVRVVTLDESFSRRGLKLAPMETHEGVEIVRIPFYGSTRYPIAPQVLGQLAGADLIHVHAVDFFFDFVALTRGLRQCPIVATTHGGFFHTAKHTLLKRIWFHTITRLTASAYRAVVASSLSDFETFSAIAPRNARLIENGVDIEKFKGAASPLPSRSLLTIGRFSLNKKLDLLLESFRQLVRDGEDWRLDIVGMESDWTREDLRREIAARGLEQRVTVHVGADNAAIARLMSRASLFVSASDYEGFGIVLVEALSAGLLPVVHGNEAFRSFAARRGGVRICDYTDPMASAEAIRAAFVDLAGAPHMRDDLIKISEGYAWPQVARTYLELYRECVEASSRGLQKPIPI